MMRSRGNPNAPITLVIEPGSLDGEGAKRLLKATLGDHGFKPEDCYVVTGFPPIPEMMQGSDKEEAAWLAEHREEFLDRMAVANGKITVAFGKLATRICSGKAVKITRVRGQAWEYPDIDTPVLTSYAPNHVLRRPELMDIFTTDLFFLRRFADADWDFDTLKNADSDVDYQWCTDLQEWIDNPPKALAVDTEGTGLDWYRPDVWPLTVQLCAEAGRVLVVPIHTGFWPGMDRRMRSRIIGQLKQVLENPATKCFAHNTNFDGHILAKVGIEVPWWMDTVVMAFAADDNMTDKSLDECVRRWVPEMAGYADEFNRTVDKSRMIDVPKPKFLQYAAGDADALFRLCKNLTEIVRRDPRQWMLLNRVQMPAIRAFGKVVERQGVMVNTVALTELQEALDIEHDLRQRQLLDGVPNVVKRRHADKGLSFTRADFVRDILFSDDGFGLTPRVFTKSTQKKPDEEKIPSTSAKDHLPYFDEPWVEEYIEFSKIGKMRSTYVGNEWDTKKACPTGFWKYLWEERIHPSFNLHVTVTGRTSSRNPNAQNFPKRGRLAKAYRKCFVPTPGYVFVETDLSQAELRVAAWMASETNMLAIYANDGDVHAATAAAVLGVSLETFMSWKGDTTLLWDIQDRIPGAASVLRGMPEENALTTTLGQFFDLQRFRAKAVNFGFLYGMGWRKFMVYAKTDYGLNYTEEEAKHQRQTFFDLYPGFVQWHKDMEKFVRDHGYVRSLHGALRRLPAVYSSEETQQWSAIRQAINSPVQRFASDLGLITLARLTRDCPLDEIRPVMFVHDALVLEVREDKLDEYLGAIRFYMESNPLPEMFGITPPIPIKADVSWGRNLAEMEEVRVEPVAPAWHQMELDLAA